MEKIHAIIGAIVVLAVVGLVAMNMTGRAVTVVSGSSNCIQTGDFGKDPYVKGTVVYLKDKKEVRDPDVCSRPKPDKLIEYYCDEKGSAAYVEYSCDCQDGICISPEK